MWDLGRDSKGVRKRQDEDEGAELWGAGTGIHLCLRELIPAQGHGHQLRTTPTWEPSCSLLLTCICREDNNLQLLSATSPAAGTESRRDI